MTADPKERIETLESQVQPVDPQDTMAEAGRKVLLSEFVNMLKLEAGSRTGEDIEDVHHMRVAIRRMRSAFRLLRTYYRPKVMTRYGKPLRKVARTLGAVRDLDVLIADLKQYQSTLDEEEKSLVQSVVEQFDQDRVSARRKLNRLFDSKDYRRFVRDFSDFLSTEGEGARTLHSDEVTPVQLRHVLPGMIHDCLASVLAYDTALEDADGERLHGLRIEFKRLRYAVSLFEDTLGSQAKSFIADLKRIQDHLGRLNDIRVAQEYFDGHDALQPYTEQLNIEAAELMAAFPAVWSRFSTRKVQSKLSGALLNLR
jgi:CHAD domain-containing protein